MGPKGWKKWRTAASVREAGGMLSTVMTRDVPRGGRAAEAACRPGGPDGRGYELNGALRGSSSCSRNEEGAPSRMAGGRGRGARGNDGGKVCGKAGARCCAGGSASCWYGQALPRAQKPRSVGARERRQLSRRDRRSAKAGRTVVVSARRAVQELPCAAPGEPAGCWACRHDRVGQCAQARAATSAAAGVRARQLRGRRRRGLRRPRAFERRRWSRRGRGSGGRPGRRAIWVLERAQERVDEGGRI